MASRALPLHLFVLRPPEVRLGELDRVQQTGRPFRITSSIQGQRGFVAAVDFLVRIGRILLLQVASVAYTGLLKMTSHSDEVNERN
jgi:hypothetical protein